jgi:hypothetical protein
VSVTHPPPLTHRLRRAKVLCPVPVSRRQAAPELLWCVTSACVCRRTHGVQSRTHACVYQSTHLHVAQQIAEMRRVRLPRTQHVARRLLSLRNVLTMEALETETTPRGERPYLLGTHPVVALIVHSSERIVALCCVISVSDWRDQTNAHSSPCARSNCSCTCLDCCVHDQRAVSQVDSTCVNELTRSVLCWRKAVAANASPSLICARRDRGRKLLSGDRHSRLHLRSFVIVWHKASCMLVYKLRE